VRALALGLPLLLAACAHLPGSPVTVSDGRYVMGTALELTLVAPDEEAGRAALVELFREAARLEALLTVYDPESEISRLNRAAGQGPQRVSPEVAEVLRLSRSWSELTRGSFDVTVGPLVALWTRAARRGTPPTPEELATARDRVGWRAIRVHEDGSAELSRRGVSVNLGGVAKGYALERMRPILVRHGIEDALLNFGQSSTWALGRPQDGDAWRLLARGPGESFLGVVQLEDRALSVSGSLGQWVEIGGRRYGHVLDPRTGDALQRRRQAMVVARDAGLAEALSKALLVLEAEEAIALIEGQAGCEALLVDAEGSVWHTPGWDAAVRFEPLPAPGAGSP
jgi:thiamine biosynthesis lipoprotein